MQNIFKKLLVTWVVLVGSTLAGVVYAGPVILGGDDLTDHGSVSAGVNLAGWQYIENATFGILAAVTRPGAIGNGVAVLGAAPSGATSDNAGAILGCTKQISGVWPYFLL